MGTKGKVGWWSLLTARPFCACLYLPFTVVFLPLISVVFALYKKKVEHFNEEAQVKAPMEIFMRRPLSTIILGMPIYSIVGMCCTEDVLVLHPLQVHIRTMQMLFQTLFDDLPCIIIDILIILNPMRNKETREFEDTTWFIVSFIYSCAFLLIVCATMTREIHYHENSNADPESPAIYTPSLVGKSAN